MAKIYLIESKEKKGLVKIGYTGRDVADRINEYAAGMSESATVYETNGAMVFERYLHNFVGSRRKNITIRLEGRGVIEPKEWFNLPPEIVPVLVNVFTEDPPQRIEDVEISNLPTFLSGVLSAINFHAERATGGDFAAIEGEVSVGDDLPLAEFAGRMRRAEYELANIHKTETDRTVIAITWFVVLTILLFTRAVDAALISGLVAAGLIISWPYVKPYAVTKAKEFYYWLESKANEYREKYAGVTPEAED